MTSIGTLDGVHHGLDRCDRAGGSASRSLLSARSRCRCTRSPRSCRCWVRCGIIYNLRSSPCTCSVIWVARSRDPLCNSSTRGAAIPTSADTSGWGAGSRGAEAMTILVDTRSSAGQAAQPGRHKRPGPAARTCRCAWSSRLQDARQSPRAEPGLSRLHRRTCRGRDRAGARGLCPPTSRPGVHHHLAKSAPAGLLRAAQQHEVSVLVTGIAGSGPVRAISR